jgi:hypothetical protein
MPVPDFSPGEVLTAAAMDSIGLWLVKTQTVGATVPSVTVTDAFSADYDNYKIVYTGGVGSTGIVISMRLGATISGYYSQTIYSLYSSTAGPISNVPDNNAAQWTYVGRANANSTYMSTELFMPFLASRTYFNTFGISTADMTATAGLLDNTTSYTAFTIFPTSGTLTGGTIRVYGYRN